MIQIKIFEWLSKHNQHNQTVNALKKAAEGFRRLHPDWAASGFDEYFLLHHALPLGEGTPGGLDRVASEQLAEAWLRQINVPAKVRPRLADDLLEAAGDFLCLFRDEFEDQRRLSVPKPRSASA